MNKEMNSSNKNKTNNDVQVDMTDNKDLIPERNIEQMMKELKAGHVDQMQNTYIQKEDKVQKEINIEEASKALEVKKFKLFFVSDMDDEAKYLHEMSIKGYHFLRKEGLYYIFKKDNPSNYYYHLSYYEKDKRDSERYLKNYEEAGWSNIYHEKAEFDGVWNYFRIKLGDGETEPNIFSDRISRIALYKRMLSSWKSLLFVICICFLFMIFITYFLYTHPSSMTLAFMILSIIVMLIVIATLIIYIRAYIRIHKKLAEILLL